VPEIIAVIFSGLAGVKEKGTAMAVKKADTSAEPT
jgi:hypothetical protein